MLNAFGYPMIIPAIKSMHLSSFTYDKEKLICVQKKEMRSSLTPKTKNYQYTNKHGKKQNRILFMGKEYSWITSRIWEFTFCLSIFFVRILNKTIKGEKV
jgi:hypothetical protein